MYDGEEVLIKVGAKKLSESRSGREYLDRVRKKHRIDLLQPGDKDFGKYYSK